MRAKKKKWKLEVENIQPKLCVHADLSQASAMFSWSSLLCFVVSYSVVSLLLSRVFGLGFVGLTGGIATGKSTTSGLLQSGHGRWCGCRCGSPWPVIDFDLLAREVVKPGRRAYRAIVQLFGPSVLLPNGELDRRALGARCFADRALLKKVAAFQRGPILMEFARQALVLFFLRGAREVLLDVPLLFEGGLYRVCDESVLVDAQSDVQKERVMQRDNVDLKTAEDKINAQWPPPAPIFSGISCHLLLLSTSYSLLCIFVGATLLSRCNLPQWSVVRYAPVVHFLLTQPGLHSITPPQPQLHHTLHSCRSLGTYSTFRFSLSTRSRTK